MTGRSLWLAISMIAAVPACRSQAPDPAPPPAGFELVVAPPGARGARAAGTDAAPPAATEAEVAAPSSEEPEPEGKPELDGGGETDAGAEADAAPGVAL